MSYLHEITKDEFSNLTWFISETQVSISKQENGKAVAWGNVFFKLDSDRDSEEDTENLPLLWLEYNATVEQTENNTLLINIDKLEDDEYETNLISFCKQDLHLAKQLVSAACAATHWQDLVLSNIHEQF